VALQQVFSSAVNPTLERSYRARGYAPMVELLRYWM
jgi:hypothetical protein